MPEIHRILAELLLRSDAGSGVSCAVSELGIAHDLRPGDFETTSKLAQLLMTQGPRIERERWWMRWRMSLAFPRHGGCGRGRCMPTWGRSIGPFSLLKGTGAESVEPTQKRCSPRFIDGQGAMRMRRRNTRRSWTIRRARLKGWRRRADFFATQKQLETAERFLRGLRRMLRRQAQWTFCGRACSRWPGRTKRRLQRSIRRSGASDRRAALAGTGRAISSHG